VNQTALSEFIHQHFNIDSVYPTNSFLLVFSLIREIVYYQLYHGFRYPQAALRIRQNDLSLKFGIRFWKDTLLTIHYTEFDNFYNTMRNYDLRDYVKAFGISGYIAQGIDAIPNLEASIQKELKKTERATHIDIAGELSRLIVVAKKVHASAKYEDDVLKLYHQKANTMLSEDILALIYEVTNAHPFDQVRSRTNSIAYHAISLLRDAGCTDEFILEKFLDSIHFRKEKSLTRKGSVKSIMDPSHYIRAAKAMSTNIDIGIEEAINNAMELMVKITEPSLFLGALLIDSNTDDTALVCGMIRNRCLLQCNETNSILLINPSPYFLRTWPTDFHKNTQCCVANNLLCNAYSHEFPDMTFITAVSFISNQSFPDYDRIVYFFSNAVAEFQQIYDFYLTQYSSTNRKTPIHIMGLIPTNTLDQSADYRETITKYDSTIISLLPQGASLSTPRRKSLVSCAKNIKRSYKVYIERCEFYNLTGQHGNTVIGRRTGNMSTIWLTAAEMINLPDGKTIHDAYQFYRYKREHANKTISLRAHAKGICYSPEITIWYKISEIKAKVPTTSVMEDIFDLEHTRKSYKTEASVHLYPTKKELKRNKVPRGTTIPGAYASKVTSSEGEAKYWLALTAPYHPRIHGAIVSAFHSGRTLDKHTSSCTSPILDGPLSLRTLWYVNLNLQHLSDNNRTVLLEKEIAESDVGLLKLGVATEHDYEHYMETLFEEYGATVDERKRMWNALSGIIDRAKGSGYCRENPVAAIAQAYRERHTPESKIRENLTKKSFTLSEMSHLYHTINNLIDTDWRYIGCMLRLFYGMPSNVICALRWSDLHTTSCFNIQQLWPRGQVYGSDFVPFDKAEAYRRLPLISYIADRLQHRRKEIQNKFNIRTTALKQQYIMLSDNEIVDNPSQIPSTRKLNELSRTIVTSIGIPEELIVLPDDGTGTTETNLTYYGGDIFRSNFDYHARNSIKLEMGQLNFLLNRQQTNTYEKHYCDYHNDAIQLQIQVALEGWYNKLQKANHEVAKQQVHRGNFTWLVQNDVLTAVEEIDLYAHADLSLNYTAECPTGMDVTAKLIKLEE